MLRETLNLFPLRGCLHQSSLRLMPLTMAVIRFSKRWVLRGLIGFDLVQEGRRRVSLFVLHIFVDVMSLWNGRGGFGSFLQLFHG